MFMGHLYTFFVYKHLSLLFVAFENKVCCQMDMTVYTTVCLTLSLTRGNDGATLIIPIPGTRQLRKYPSIGDLKSGTAYP